MRLVCCLLLLTTTVIGQEVDPLEERWLVIREQLVDNRIGELVRDTVGVHWDSLRADWARNSEASIAADQERMLISLLAPLHEEAAVERIAGHITRICGKDPVVLATAFEGSANQALALWRTRLPPASQLADYVEAQIPRWATWLMDHPPLDSARHCEVASLLVRFVRRHDLRNSGSFRRLTLEQFLSLCSDAVTTGKSMLAVFGVACNDFLSDIDMTVIERDERLIRFDLTWDLLGQPWRWHLQASASPAGWMVSEYHPPTTGEQDTE